MYLVSSQNKIEYYNHTDYDYSKKNDFYSFFLIMFLLILFFNIVRFCVFLAHTYKKKYLFSKLNNFNHNVPGVNAECPICMELVDSDNFVLYCTHAFHKRCLYQWVNTSMTNNSFKCPLCNVIYEIN